jgi:ParB/RepB/Spo0J family partition protein
VSILEDIRVDKIIPNLMQHRDDAGDLTTLVDSIKAIGLIEPVVVRISDNDTFTLMAGHRRVEAAKLAGLVTIPAIVHGSMDARTEAGMLLAENTVRRDLTAVEEANGIQTMLNVGWKEPGTAIGRSTERVAQSVKVAAMPDALKTVAVQATLDEAYALAEFADNKKALKALTKAIGTGGFAYVVQGERRNATEKARYDEIAAPIKAAGVKLVRRDWMHHQRELVALGITPEDHASCPGHAAIVETYGDGKVIYVCTDSVANGHVADANAKVDAKRAKEREAAAKVAAGWADACAVRTAFLAKFVRAKLPSGTLPWAFGIIYEADGMWGVPDRFTAIWGKEPGIVADKNAPGMFVALAAAYAEKDMSRFDYVQEPAQTKRYLELLMTEGYELSKPERAYYDAAVAKLKPKSDAKGATVRAEDCDDDCENCDIAEDCEDAS